MKQIESRTVPVAVLGVITIAIIGCAQPPTEQLEAARQAFETAKAAEAPTYAKEEFAKLEQQLALAKDELAKQEQAISVFRSYSDAQKMLIKVVEDGGHIAAKAAQDKEAAKKAAVNREKEAQEIVTSAKELLAKAPTGKERAAVETIKQDLAGLETSLGAVHLLIEKGDYLSADVQAIAVKEKSAAVSAEIQSAIHKAGGKKSIIRG